MHNYSSFILAVIFGSNAYGRLLDPKTIETKAPDGLPDEKSDHDTSLDYPYSMLREINDPFMGTDTPLFWHIPKSGGSSLKHIIGMCLSKISASSDAAVYCGDPVQEIELRVCHTDFGDFVNSENGEVDGIRKSQKLGLVSSGLADVIVSTNFQLSSFLFNNEYSGRAFAVFRHPIDRIVSTFYYLGQAEWEPNYNPQLASMTILEYAQSGLCPSNWVTRNILGVLDHVEVVLTEKDIHTAKEILRRKIFILMADDIPSSLNQLLSYLGWESSQPQIQSCILNDLGSKANHGHYDQLEEGSEAWNLIAERNKHDMDIYEYARELYDVRKENLGLGII